MDYNVQLPPMTADIVSAASALRDIMNYGQTYFDFEGVWEKSKGDDAIVFVMDTGIVFNHPDLLVSEYVNFSDSPSYYDEHGHGTHVAGIIGAKANGDGVVGIAPNCELISVKVLNDSGAGTNDAIAKGIMWCAAHTSKKKKIINLSLGATQGSQALINAIDYAKAKGCVIIAAAGNHGDLLDYVNYPANYREVIAVGSVSNDIIRSSFSAYGDVDVVAFGEHVYSTYLDGNYAKLSGTSQATPYVAGIAALYSYSDYFSHETFLKVIRDFSIDVHTKGKDDTTGWGLINPEAIVNHYVEQEETLEKETNKNKPNILLSVIGLITILTLISVCLVTVLK